MGWVCSENDFQETALIVVTGGAGFIGHHTLRALSRRSACVRVFDDFSTGTRERLAGLDVEVVRGCVTDRDAVRKAIAGADAVLHLAAMVSVPASFDDPARCRAVNEAGFRHVLDAAADLGVSKVAYASSCAVYGSLPGLPKAEGDPLAPQSPYAESKRRNEDDARDAAARGVNTVGLRYFNVYGPGQDPSGPYGAVLPTFLARARAGEPLVIHGDGDQGRDFVHVDDVARANVAALFAPTSGAHVVNIGSGRMHTIRELAQQIASRVNGVSCTHVKAREGDVRQSCAAVAEASRLLDWSPRVTLGQGLDALV